MRQNLIISVIAIALLTTPALAGSNSDWLHVSVEERGWDEETVKVNLPLDLVESLLPLIDVEGFERGRIYIDSDELEDIDIQDVVAQLKDAPDAEYVSVQGRHENVNISKKDGFLLVDVEGHHEDVKIRIPFEVATAAFTEGNGEIDLVALIKALRKHGETELVTVEEEDTTVRIWIDHKKTID